MTLRNVRKDKAREKARQGKATQRKTSSENSKHRTSQKAAASPHTSRASRSKSWMMSCSSQDGRCRSSTPFPPRAQARPGQQPSSRFSLGTAVLAERGTWVIARALGSLGSLGSRCRLHYRQHYDRRSMNFLEMIPCTCKAAGWGRRLG